MRTETDDIGGERCYCYAEKSGLGVEVSVYDWYESASVRLTKQQAREFAKQILEMCGDGDDE